MDVSREIQFQTTRSGGKGGQHVNKVETAVIAAFHIEDSTLLSATQKVLIKEKLEKRIGSGGFLKVKAQEYRTQLENKVAAAVKINALIREALHKKKARIATKASKASIASRLDTKKEKGRLKESRKKVSRSDV